MSRAPRTLFPPISKPQPNLAPENGSSEYIDLVTKQINQESQFYHADHQLKFKLKKIWELFERDIFLNKSIDKESESLLQNAGEILAIIFDKCIICNTANKKYIHEIANKILKLKPPQKLIAQHIEKISRKTSVAYQEFIEEYAKTTAYDDIAQIASDFLESALERLLITRTLFRFTGRDAEGKSIINPEYEQYQLKIDLLRAPQIFRSLALCNEQKVAEANISSCLLRVSKEERFGQFSYLCLKRNMFEVSGKVLHKSAGKIFAQSDLMDNLEAFCVNISDFAAETFRKAALEEMVKINLEKDSRARELQAAHSLQSLAPAQQRPEAKAESLPGPGPDARKTTTPSKVKNSTVCNIL